MTTPAQPGGLAWSDVDRGKVTDANWSRWLDSGLPIDPYMVWADMTELAGFGGRSVTEEQWPLLIELKQAENTLPASGSGAERGVPPTDVGVAFAMLSIPGAYLRENEAGQRRTVSQFITARASPRNIDMLLRSAEIERMQLGIPRLPKVEGTGLNTELLTSGRDDDVPRTVVGIIDDGCAFAHPAFCNSTGEPRVWFLWDQDEARKPTDTGDKEGTEWRSFRGFGYGAELGYRALRKAVSMAVGGDELAPYRHVDYVPVASHPDLHATSLQRTGQPSLPTGTMLAATHGTGVMDLAAGVPGPRRMQAAVVDDPRALPVGRPDAADSAAAWPIVFVQLPTRTVLDTSGGSLGVHVLDGLRYIMRRADLFPYEPSDSDPSVALTPPPGGDLADVPNVDPKDNKIKYVENLRNNLVINVSFGAIAGPHDGTSIIEEAMADIVRVPDDIKSYRRRTWIVLAAGNSHRNGTHVRMQFGATLDQHRLVWRVGPDNPAETYLELWLPGVDVNGDPVHAQALADFIVDIQPPGSRPPAQLRSGRGKLLHATPAAGGPDVPVMGALFARRVVQGRSGTMVLLAVGPTRRPLAGQAPARAPAPHGDWIVDISLVDAEHKKPMLVHAWAERNDLLFGLRRRQQATVTGEVRVPEPTEFFPEALWFKKAFGDGQGTWYGAEPPRPMQPDSALGSLANVAPSRPDPWVVAASGDARLVGALVVTGAYRLADGEMSPYSSGGPVRASAQDAGLSRVARHSKPSGKATTAPGNTGTGAGDALAKPRRRPDVDAPADIGVALRGVRVVGTLPGSYTRISGTSAAAPQVARYIANHRYWYDWNCRAGADPSSGLTPDHSPAPPARQRPAATPHTDDEFRRGRQRLG